MKTLDDAIRGAVSKEDAEFLAKLESEEGTVQQVVGVFRGPMRWFYTLLLIAGVLLGIFGVYACWRFATVTDLRPLLYWGAATGFSLLALTVVRILFFMQMNTNRVLRELKRLELQIALLAAARAS